jgi:hypothetical protein
MGQLELTRPRDIRPRKGALLIAKQLTFHKRFRQGGTVERHKTTARTQAARVQLLGEKVLSGTAFSENQDRQIALRDALRLLKNFAYRRGRTNHVSELTLGGEVLAQAANFLTQLLALHGARHY